MAIAHRLPTCGAAGPRKRHTPPPSIREWNRSLRRPRSGWLQAVEKVLLACEDINAFLERLSRSKSRTQANKCSARPLNRSRGAKKVTLAQGVGVYTGLLIRAGAVREFITVCAGLLCCVASILIHLPTKAIQAAGGLPTPPYTGGMPLQGRTALARASA